ncbi:MAG: M23 family metallopeptidase [Rikenellaceae bacterium]
MSEKESNIGANTVVSKVRRSSFQMRAYTIVRAFLVGFLIASTTNAVFSYVFYTPKAHQINTENIELVRQYEMLQGRINAAQNRLDQIANRDNEVYRSLFGLDKLPSSDLTKPYPRSNYESLEGDPYSPLLISTWEKMDVLAKNIYYQSLSFDELQQLAKSKERLASAIPAVWPIDRTELKWGIGAFGMRLHPIYKRNIMHKGIDLACDTGKPVYATADAIVERSLQGLRNTGYGQMLLLKHEFGYQTRYAHLSQRFVNKGDTVRRGDIIGLVGSTGGSTGPHLHYEVIVNGKVVNPINFFNRDMSKEEYQLLMSQVNESNIRESNE